MQCTIFSISFQKNKFFLIFYIFWLAFNRLEEELRELVHISEGEDLDHSILNPFEHGPKRGESCRETSRSLQSVYTSSKSKTFHNLPRNRTLQSMLKSSSRNEAIGLAESPKEVICSNEIEDGFSPNHVEIILPGPDGLDIEIHATTKQSHQVKNEFSNNAGSKSAILEKSPLRCKHGCKFIRDGTISKIPCKHFPCILPTTYHALGFRRDDITTWCPAKLQNDSNNLLVLGLDNTTNTPSRKLRQNSVFEESPSNKHRELENNTANITGSNVRDQKYKPDSEDFMLYCDTAIPADKEFDEKGEIYTTLIPKWMRGKQPKKFSFRPVSGPAFAPKPRDPILERVRQGSAATQSLDRQPPRMTVAGRMRGLRSLIHEMREKHEKARPVDWSVNYGQRLPMRVLLNPVIPDAII